MREKGGGGGESVRISPFNGFYWRVCAEPSNICAMRHLIPNRGKSSSSSSLGSRRCPMFGQRPQHAVSKLACLVQSSAISCRSSICPGRLSTAWLVSLIAFSCHGLQVVTCVVYWSSLRHLICSAQDHFIFLILLILAMTCVFSLTQISRCLAYAAQPTMILRCMSLSWFFSLRL